MEPAALTSSVPDGQVTVTVWTGSVLAARVALTACRPDTAAAAGRTAVTDPPVTPTTATTARAAHRRIDFLKLIAVLS
ncbi:hypothetical protein Vau01_039980 [Virgisporangium aurantiacum]|uniref:Uncharacterized protein n=1 Tax=Virgisporangium aurantiacum TaxID=175570 RepID=A0A8J3Z4X4_9ACTN|nr:hypothetical protein Vau01_039980 [Virgisporangium aurantiacum]